MSHTSTASALSEVLAIAARMRCVDEYWLLTAERDGYSDALCGACAPRAPAHRPVSRLYSRVSPPFREPLQFIVMAVMSVMSGAFPDTNGVFCMTVNCQCIWGP